MCACVCVCGGGGGGGGAGGWGCRVYRGACFIGGLSWVEIYFG